MTLPSSQIFPSPQSCNTRRVFIPLQDLYLCNELSTMKAILMISASLWACSHLLQDPIEMQVTWHGMATTPITTDSEVSLGDRDVMSSAKGRHCASALTGSSSSALPRIPNSSFLQPLHFKSNFFSTTGFISAIGWDFSFLFIKSFCTGFEQF